MSRPAKAKRTYLISYVITSPLGVGRFFNDRETDSAPSREDIEVIEEKLCADHGAKVVVVGVSRVEAGEIRP